MPTSFKRTATNRDEEEAKATFPFESDIGIPFNEFPVVLVFNGVDHFVGTKPLQMTFEEGVNELAGLLKAAKLLSGTLIESTNASDLKSKLDIMS